VILGRKYIGDSEKSRTSSGQSYNVESSRWKEEKLRLDEYSGIRSNHR